MYKYLREQCSVMPQQNLMQDQSLIDWTPVTGSDVSWNFEKFLVSKKGVPYKRYNYMTMPNDATLVADIQYLLNQ